MQKFIPKTALDWIWLSGIVTLIGLVVFTLAAGASPFEILGLDPRTTTIVFGLLVIVGIATPYFVRKIRE